MRRVPSRRYKDDAVIYPASFADDDMGAPYVVYPEVGTPYKVKAQEGQGGASTAVRKDGGNQIQSVKLWVIRIGQDPGIATDSRIVVLGHTLLALGPANRVRSGPGGVALDFKIDCQQIS